MNRHHHFHTTDTEQPNILNWTKHTDTHRGSFKVLISYSGNFWNLPRSGPHSWLRPWAHCPQKEIFIIHWSATTLKPLTGDMNNVGYIATIAMFPSKVVNLTYAQIGILHKTFAKNNIWNAETCKATFYDEHGGIYLANVFPSSIIHINSFSDAMETSSSRYFTDLHLSLF